MLYIWVVSWGLTKYESFLPSFAFEGDRILSIQPIYTTTSSFERGKGNHLESDNFSIFIFHFLSSQDTCTWKGACNSAPFLKFLLVKKHFSLPSFLHFSKNCSFIFSNSSRGNLVTCKVLGKPLTLKRQCKPHGLGIILGESCSKLLLHCTKWGF